MLSLKNSSRKIKKMSFPKSAGSICEKALLFPSWCNVLLSPQESQCQRACGGGGGAVSGPGCDMVVAQLLLKLT